eukprot:scaffold6301_cov165-Amphora_coffeaeformis.AAC.16
MAAKIGTVDCFCRDSIDLRGLEAVPDGDDVLVNRFLSVSALPVFRENCAATRRRHPRTFFAALQSSSTDALAWRTFWTRTGESISEPEDDKLISYVALLPAIVEREESGAEENRAEQSCDGWYGTVSVALMGVRVRQLVHHGRLAGCT